MSLLVDGSASTNGNDQRLLRRKQWFQSVLWSIQTQKVRIDSNPFLSGTVFIGKNVTYEMWIEIKAKVFDHKTLNEEILYINLQRVNASVVFKDISQFRYLETFTISNVNDLLNRYEGVTSLYPTLKEMEAGHPEVRSDKVAQNLTALIEYQKIWEDAQIAKRKIAFLKSIGPPFYSSEGTAEENSLFFSRFAIDEELQSLFRVHENSLWHFILPRMKAGLEKNRIVFASLGLPTDLFEMESHVKFLYQFQTRATICFTDHIESVWMEERTEIVDVILNEVLRKLEFILENGLLLVHDLHFLCGESELALHFEGIDTLIDRFEKLVIRRIKFSQDFPVLKLVKFLEKSWFVISRLSVQASFSNTLRYINTFCDVENAFIDKLSRQIDSLKDVGPAFFRKLELMKDPVAHVLDFYRKLDAQTVKFVKYSGNLLIEKDLLSFLKTKNYVLINFSDSYLNRFKDGVCVFGSPNLAIHDKYVDILLQSLAQTAMLVEKIPAGCYLLLVSHIDRSYWEGAVVDVEMKFAQMPLPASSISFFPPYTVDKYSLDGFFVGNKYDKSTWFLSSTMQTFFAKISNNMQLLAYQLIETSKSMQIPQEFRRTFYILHEIFQFTFDFVCEIPEFLKEESLKGGIVDGLVDICSNWIYFSLKGLESKHDSLCRLVDILEKITDKISIYFDGLTHEQFEKLRSAIAAAMGELVHRQIYSELEPQDKIRQGDFPAEIYMRRECFQPDRESRIMNHIHDLESKLDLMHGVGIVIERKVDSSLEKNLSNISSNLPITKFRWRKGKFLNGNAFSKVYLGRNMDAMTILAIKEYDVRDVYRLRRLITYGRNVIQLDHPNICKYYGIAIERSKIYILMEFNGEGTLEKLLNSGRIENEETIKKYSREILEGIKYLHSQGIIHRDIKPSNILFGPKNQIKISGFTCVGMETDSTGLDEDKSFGLIGTARYIPPEMIRGEKSIPPTAQDIWAFGIIVGQMATGAIPYYQYDNDWAVYYHIGKGELPKLPTSNEISDIGLEFIESSLTLIPNLRPKACDLLEHKWLLSNE